MANVDVGIESVEKRVSGLKYIGLDEAHDQVAVRVGRRCG
jgi:hypothetical protein